MKNKLIASAILVLFGAAFLFVAFQFAPLAHEAPSGGPLGSFSPSMPEFAYGFPALCFTIAGTVASIVGVAFAAHALTAPTNRSDPTST